MANKLKAIDEMFSSVVKLADDVIDRMTNNELRVAAKARGLWDSEKSWFQIREALKSFIPSEVNVMATKKNVKTKAPKKERAVRDGTKSAKALEIFNQNKKLPRKDVIEMFMKKLDMSKAGASTYYQNCKKKSK